MVSSVPRWSINWDSVKQTTGCSFTAEGTNSVTNEPKFTINVIYNDTFEESVQFRKVLIYFTA